MSKLLLLICVLYAISNGKARLSCRDEQNKPIDWFYLYKLPRSFPSSSNSDIHKHGLNYLYISSDSMKPIWKLSKNLINSNDSFPGKTILNVPKDNKTLLIGYNDESPYGTVDNNDGHTKGFIAADKKSGFWLIHSVPKYLNFINYTYPNTGVNYGQSFLCITMNNTEIKKVGKQLIFNEPNIYYKQFPNSLKDLYPEIVQVLNKKWYKIPPYWNFENIFSLKGTKFSSFAKGRKFCKELYEDWVAPTLNSNLFVETWNHGTGVLPTNCTRKTRVWNIVSLNITNYSYNFKSTLDHSKWTVSDEKSGDWICVGDINRAAHQLHRGGGTVCQNNNIIANAYRNLVGNIQPCPSKRKKKFN